MATMMNIQVLSKERIKPSSPTPQNLRNHRLSFLDQLSFQSYVPTIFFYDHADDNSHSHDDHLERSGLLKKSLGICLTHYYPLAGTIREEFSVDCNDEGVVYIEARVGYKLSEATKKLNVEMFNQLLPFDPFSNVIGRREALVGIKFNIFDCGGVAIGVCVSHKLADGTSASRFVNDWAMMSRACSSDGADDHQQHPIFDAALLFPPREITGFKRESKTLVTDTRDEKIVTKRFVFNKLSIIALKERASSSSSCVDECFEVPKHSPTRVQVVSALVWRTFMRTVQSKSKSGKVCAAVHAVNLRDKMVPPLPSHFFGNIWRRAMAPTMVDGENDLGSLVSLIGNAVREINDDYVRKLMDVGNSEDDSNEQVMKLGEVEFFGFSSWCGFPLYDVDFGWGMPTWVCPPMTPYKNMAILMSTKEGDGIEAQVNLLEEDMAIFETDLELLSFVSLVQQ